MMQLHFQSRTDRQTHTQTNKTSSNREQCVCVSGGGLADDSQEHLTTITDGYTRDSRDKEIMCENKMWGSS